jgi:hypothetical protein
MRIHSFIKVCIAILTIAFAMTMSTVPGSTRMQASPVLTSNITQIRVLCQSPNYGPPCGPYDKIAPDRWVQRTQDGNVLNYVEVSRGDNTMSLFNGASPGETVMGTRVDFDFSGMKYSGGVTSRTSPTEAVGSAFTGGVITGVYEISADNSPETCTQQTTAPGAKCNCDLRSLRPLQGAVGMEEVRDKEKDIRSGKKKRLDLAYDPIKIARGPNGLLYVTDHHHGARAWLEAGHTMGTCQIQSDTISTDPTQFWADLNRLKLVRLADKDGKSITATQLPTTLATLPDDPYRTLAWRVRKGDGFCRALMTGNKEFAEFQWADWLRKRAEFKNPPGPNGDWSKSKRAAAIELAKDPTKANDPFVQSLPGYRGDKPLAYTCAADPD